MSALKGILGFIVGLFACGILMLLFTLRSPIQTEPALENTGSGVEAVVSEDTNTSSNDAQATREAESQTSQEVDVVEPAVKPIVEPEVQPETMEPEQPTITPEPTIEEPKVEEPITDEIKKPSIEESLIEAPSDATKIEQEISPELDLATTETPQPELNEEEIALLQPEISTTVEKPKATQLKTVGTLGSSSGFKSSTKANKTKTDTEEVTLGAFALNTQNYAEPEGAVLAVILTDVGQQGLTRSDILKTTFPMSVAINANMRGAANAAADFYDGGFEVLVQNPLTGAQLVEEADANAVQNRLDEFLAAVPNAVGFVDNPRGVLQKTRPVQQAVLDRFEDTGHAVLSFKRGLDNTKREASKRNLPSGTVFRVLDENGETRETIARYLNRAVLEANQEGSAIVLGKATKETFDAIQAWVDSGKSEAITLVPVSAAIRAQK